MTILETDDWCLLLPPEWEADNEDGVVSIGDTDGVGELLISTLKRDGDASPEGELSAMARSESPDVETWRPATLGAFSGVTGQLTIEGDHLREWYVAAGACLLFITYCCDLENAGLDDAAVDELLGTLVAASD